MIVNVRGTHGSGKSTLVRKIMKRYGHREPIFIDGRRLPIGYVCSPKRKRVRSLFVAGHYEGDVGGGCDTILSVDVMFRMIRRYARRGFDVLYEGILAQHSTPNAIRLQDHHDVRVVLIAIPLKQSIRGVRRRRRKRGDARPFDPKNIVHEHAHRSLNRERIRGDGLRLYSCATRRQALRRALTLLEL